MDKSGALEIKMPVVQPAELWEESGRWEQYGPELLRFEDRGNRHFVLGPTHEEVITDNNNTYQIVDNTQEINVTVTAQRSVLDKIRAEDIVATANMKELTLRTQVPIEVTIKGYTGKYEKGNGKSKKSADSDR